MKFCENVIRLTLNAYISQSINGFDVIQIESNSLSNGIFYKVDECYEQKGGFYLSLYMCFSSKQPFNFC